MNSAYYLFGLQNNKFLYLDPHKVRKGDKKMNF